MKALLIIDMLNDFVRKGASLYIEGAERIIPNIKREIEKAHKEGYPVIYICDAHSPDDEEFKVWPKHAVKGTEGAQIVEELKPREGDIIIEKKRYSGFYKTNLESILKEKGIKELILTGVAANICVLFTAGDALQRGFKVKIPEDCVAGLTEDDVRFLIREMRILQPGEKD